MTTESQLDTRILSDFIYELNIARRHLATYPPGHPMIVSATEKVLPLLGQLFETRDRLSFGIAENALLFEQNWLDKQNPVYRDFAAALSRIGIAAIHFNRHPSFAELIAVNQLLRLDRQAITAGGGFNQLLAERRVSHIEMTPVDYSEFHTTDEDQLNIGAMEQPLWQDFLAGLLGNSPGSANDTEQKNPTFDPKIVAEMLNHKFTSQTVADQQNYDQAITSFIGKLQHFKQQEQLSAKFSSLISQLSPELKRQFLNSTFRNLDGLQQSNKFLESLPSELVLTILDEANQNRLNISAIMVNLLGKLSEHHLKDGQQSLTSGGSRQPESDVEQQLRAIFREEADEKFTPDSYQQALDAILSIDHELRLPAEEVALLRQSMAELSIEQHSSAIIFQLLKSELTEEQCEGLQQNLIDLARSFLAFADFTGLRLLHCGLIDFCHQHPQHRARTDRLLNTLQSASFQKEVLDNLQRWEQEKQEEIRAYLEATGEAFAKSLVQRLADEQNKTLRRFYLNVLVGMGHSAHPAIYAALPDDRWFLVRNLLTVLRLQKGAVDLDKILPLVNHPHLRVNQEVLKLLFQNDRSRADSLLLKQLDNRDPELLLHAVQLAELSKDPLIVTRLIDLLNNLKLSEENLPLKLQLIRSLGMSGQEAVLPSFNKLLFSRNFFGADRLQQVQLEILNQLNLFPYAAVKPLLEKLVLTRRGELSNRAGEKLRQLIRSSA